VITLRIPVPGILSVIAIFRQGTGSSGGMPFQSCYFWQFSFAPGIH